jgi:hypothetical protein
VDYVAAGSIGKDVVKQRIGELQIARSKLQRERQNLQSQYDLLSHEATTVEKLERTRLWWAAYAEELEDADKRVLVDALVEEIGVYPFEHRFKGHPNPDDCRTPASVHVEIKGHIPIRKDRVFGERKVVPGQAIPKLRLRLPPNRI